MIMQSLTVKFHLSFYMIISWPVKYLPDPHLIIVVWLEKKRENNKVKEDGF